MRYLRRGPLAAVCAASIAALALTPSDARACGGCFHPVDEPETTVVTAHRMALSVSTAQTVLWDQVQYAGAPSEFAWVLPIKPGAYIELSSDTWFEALDAATSKRVSGPDLDCPSFGGGADRDFDDSGCGCIFPQADMSGGLEPRSATIPGEAPEPPPVTVVHEGSVGPYDTVTVHANVPNALPDWLTTNGYAIDPSITPVIDAYVAEGFDFIALKLQPGADVRQMKPVRVVSPGASPVLPLRMVAAGTGANVDVTLFVIGEGRWDAENFPNAVVHPEELVWDFVSNASNYALRREEVMAQEKGRTWLSTYAKPGALLSPITDPETLTPVTYSIGVDSVTTFGEFFARLGEENGEGNAGCIPKLLAVQTSGSLVVDLCADGGPSGGGGGAGGGGGGGGAGGTGGSGAGECATLEGGQIDAATLACGDLDDMAVALTGLHPKDVWLTRLESKLPRSALSADFALKPATQEPVENLVKATKALNAPCPVATAAPRIMSPDQGSAERRSRKGWLMIGLAAAALASAVLRRARRPVDLAAARAAR